MNAPAPAVLEDLAVTLRQMAPGGVLSTRAHWENEASACWHLHRGCAMRKAADELESLAGARLVVDRSETAVMLHRAADRVLDLCEGDTDGTLALAGALRDLAGPKFEVVRTTGIMAPPAPRWAS